MRPWSWRGDSAQSLYWASGITAALLAVGVSSGMALAHGSMLFALPYLPAIAVMSLLSGAPDWFVLPIAAAAEFGVIFVLVVVIRDRLKEGE